MRLYLLFAVIGTLSLTALPSYASDSAPATSAGAALTLRESPRLSIVSILDNGLLEVKSTPRHSKDWMGGYIGSMEENGRFEINGGAVNAVFLGHDHAPFTNLLYFDSPYYSGAVAVARSGQVFAIHTQIGRVRRERLGPRYYKGARRILFNLQPLRSDSGEAYFLSPGQDLEALDRVMLQSESGAQEHLRHALMDSVDCASLLEARELELANIKF